MGYEKLMADGSVCRTGPSCRRHGGATGKPTNFSFFLGSLKAKIAAAQDDPIPEMTLAYNPSQLTDAKLSVNKIVKGVNAAGETKHPLLEQLNAESQEFEETFPEDLRDSIQHYVSSYEYVNMYLRDGRAGIEKYLTTHFLYPEQMFPDMEASINQYMGWAEERVKDMDEAFNTYRRPENNMRALFRSERVPEGRSMEQHLAKFTPGTIIENKNYTSTSVDSDYMLVVNNPGENKDRIVVFEILSKEGIPVHKYDDFPGSPSFAEREVLLKRNSKFKVEKVVTRKFMTSYPNGKPQGGQNSNGIPKAEMVVIQMVEV